MSLLENIEIASDLEFSNTRHFAAKVYENILRDYHRAILENISALRKNLHTLMVHYLIHTFKQHKQLWHILNNKFMNQKSYTKKRTNKIFNSMSKTKKILWQN